MRMQFTQPLTRARPVRRYKRFLADVVCDDGTETTVHCPNTGAMLGCDVPDSVVWLSCSQNAKRKYPLTWEIVETCTGVSVGINTNRSNRLVREAIEAGVVVELAGYPSIQAEVTLGSGRSRIDFFLSGGQALKDCYLEVKNVTAAVQDGIAIFPDAVSARGTKHLRELIGLVESGFRAVLCFCVQRDDVAEVRPAEAIDPTYASTLREAVAAGVELIAYRAKVGPEGIALYRRVRAAPGATPVR